MTPSSRRRAAGTVLATALAVSGVGLLATNAVYRLTDPPLRFLGRFIPPLRIGAIALDLGFIVLILALSLLTRILLAL